MLFISFQTKNLDFFHAPLILCNDVCSSRIGIRILRERERERERERARERESRNGRRETHKIVIQINIEKDKNNRRSIYTLKKTEKKKENQRDVLNFLKYNQPTPTPDNSHSKDGQGHKDKYLDNSSKILQFEISNCSTH